MKDSGNRWIGKIPESWDTRRIKYLATLKGRIGWQGLTSEEYQDEGPYLVTGVDFRNGCIDWESCVHIPFSRWEEAKEIQIENGDLLITKDGTVGKVAIVDNQPDKASLNSGVLRIVTNDGYDRQFLYWVLQSEVFWNWFNFKNAGNSTIVHLYQGDFAEFMYAFPVESEQHAIAAYLDRKCGQIDDIIADLQRQIERLQSYKKSLISEAVTKGLNPDVPLKDSGARCVGKIPAHWSVSRIKYLMDGEHPYPIGDGDHGLIKSDDYLEDGIPYIRVLNLTWGRGLCMDNMVYISNDMNSMIKSSELRPRDLLIAKTGATIGKTAIVPDWISLANTTSHVGKITMPKSQCAEFFYHVLNSDVVQKQIEDMSAMQSTRPELGIDGLKNLTVTVPPMEEQQAIATYLDRKCAQIDTILDDKRKQVENMKNHRKSVIYEYVTGKKRVKEV